MKLTTYLVVLVVCGLPSLSFGSEKTKIDSIFDKKLGEVALHYSPKNRLIWIDINSINKKITLDKFEAGKNPELVGAEKNIKFITRKIVTEDGIDFIAVTYSHRTRSNDGTGGCGSGSEDYFSALKISSKKISIIKKFLIQSCTYNYLLDDNGGNSDSMPKTNEKNEIVFNWLTYPENDSGVIGYYNFTKNTLVIKSREN